MNEVKYHRRVNEYSAMEDLAKKATTTAERALEEINFFKQ